MYVYILHTKKITQAAAVVSRTFAPRLQAPPTLPQHPHEPPQTEFHSKCRRRVMGREIKSLENRPPHPDPHPQPPPPPPHLAQSSPALSCPSFGLASSLETRSMANYPRAARVHHTAGNPVEVLAEVSPPRGEIPPRIPSTAASSSSSLPLLPVATPTASVTALERGVLHISQAKRNVGSSLRNVQASHCHGCNAAAAVFDLVGNTRG